MKKIISNILRFFNYRMGKIFPRTFEKISMKNYKGIELLGVEIGVYRGEHAESILKELDIKKLYLVDPYKEYSCWMGSKRNIELSEKIMEKRMKKYSEKIKLIKKTSSEAVKEIPNELDFVYIDGNHEYEYIKEDIELYYPKLKKRGILSGHDFNKIEKGNERNVIQAVNEFAIKNKLTIFHLAPDWWVIKK